MSFNLKVLIVFITLLFFPFNANAYYNTLVKGRVGYLDINPSLNNGSKVGDGAITEIALTKFLTSNIALELGVGYSFVKTQGSSATSKKDSNMLPLNGTVQFHLPIRSTFVPYVGIGYMYQIFQNTSANPQFKIKQAGDLVFQAGMDLYIFNKLGINLDFKYSKIKHKISDNRASFKSKFKNISTMVGVTLPL